MLSTMKKFAKNIIYAKLLKYLFHNSFLMQTQWINEKRNISKHFLSKTVGFTLVELIIVITILAILAVIAFVSFQNYTKNSRDGNRIATLKTIETWLELYALKTGNYPIPENPTPLSWTHWLLIQKWYLWDVVVQAIKMNKIPLDPKYKDDKYVYSITSNWKYYQTQTIQETDILSSIPWIQATYANIDFSKYKILIKWNFPLIWAMVNNTYLPSLIFNEEVTTTNYNDFKFITPSSPSWNYTPVTDTEEYTNMKEKLENDENIKDDEALKAKIDDFLSGAEQDETLAKAYKDITWNTSSSDGETSSTPLPTTINGLCGTAEKTYAYTDTSFWTDTFCETGTPNPATPTFPTEWNPTTWNCEWTGTPKWTDASCEATITATPINGVCGTAHWKSRVNAPTTNLCSSWNATSVTTAWWNYTWSCEWVNAGTQANCSATQLLQPTAWTNTPAQTSITWFWANGWWTATKYEWSNNWTDWGDKWTALSYSETWLTCNTAYSNRVVRACDDIWECTTSRTLTNTITTTCPWTCWDNISGWWETYTTLLWPDWKCWTSQNMRHWTMLANASTLPSNDSLVEKWCYNNDSNNCTLNWWLYTWTEATWLSGICDYYDTNCMQAETPSEHSVCWALWTNWRVPTDTEWATLTSAWATWLLASIVSTITGQRKTNNSFTDSSIFWYWWSSTQGSMSNAVHYILDSSNATISRAEGKFNLESGFSVVCIEDPFASSDSY